jgi:peptidyl-prolyl cis-trans isomerase C
MAVWLAVLQGPALGGEDKGKGEAFVPVVATVNGTLVTRFDIEWKLGYASQTIRGTPEERKRQLEDLRRRITLTLVLKELVIQEMKKKGIKITDRMIQQQLRDEMKEKGGTASYYRLLAKEGLTYAENWKRIQEELYIREFERRMVTSRTHTKFVYPFFAEISVTPREVRDFYLRHPDEFQESESGLFRLIWLKFEDFGSQKATREKAEALYVRLREAPDLESRARRFADFAIEFSKGEAAAKGGARVLTAEQTLSPELHKELMRLKPGEVSTPVSTDYGFFLLFLEKPRSKFLKPFAQVQREIRDRLRTDKYREKIEQEQNRLLHLARIWPEKIARLVEKGLGP